MHFISWDEANPLASVPACTATDNVTKRLCETYLDIVVYTLRAQCYQKPEIKFQSRLINALANFHQTVPEGRILEPLSLNLRQFSNRPPFLQK